MRWSVCPVCKQEIKSASDSKFLPFCSNRCQMIDLGHWFDGNYAIASGDEPMPEGLSEETE